MSYSSGYANASPYSASTTFDRYLESEVMSADPVKLVGMLYQSMTESIATARRALASGDIPLRSKQIVKAWDIVRELDSTLDHSQGGALSRQLTELYAFVGQQLMEANAEQSDAKLAAAEMVVTTLAEAWRGVQTAVPAVARPAALEAEEYRPVSQAC